MIIGFTYDRIDDYLAMGYTKEQAAEFDSDRTIDALEKAIRDNGHTVERIGHVKNLVNALAEGKRWDLVFNITEGLHGIGRESQVPCLLDAYQIPYTFSGPEVMANTMDKSVAKLIAHKAGVPTPDFAIIRSLSDIDSVSMGFPMFAKPIAEGTSKGVSERSYIPDAKTLKDTCAFLLKEFNQSVLVESFLPGREFTVAIRGSGADAQAMGVAEITLKDGAEKHAYTYNNKVNCMQNTTLVDDKESREAADVALRAWRALNCVDAGRVDIRQDAKGRACFIEANPLAGLSPGYSELPLITEAAGIAYNDLIGGIIDGAAKRYGIGAKPMKVALG